MARQQDAEPERQSGWWYLSFADPERPAGTRFLGATIVEGESQEAAMKTAWRRSCNPGGEVLGLAILRGRVPSAPWRNRLLSKGEAYELVAWAAARWPQDT